MKKGVAVLRGQMKRIDGNGAGVNARNSKCPGQVDRGSSVVMRAVIRGRSVLVVAIMPMRRFSAILVAMIAAHRVAVKRRATHRFVMNCTIADAADDRFTQAVTPSKDDDESKQSSSAHAQS